MARLHPHGSRNGSVLQRRGHGPHMPTVAHGIREQANPHTHKADSAFTAPGMSRHSLTDGWAVAVGRVTDTRRAQFRVRLQRAGRRAARWVLAPSEPTAEHPPGRARESTGLSCPRRSQRTTEQHRQLHPVMGRDLRGSPRRCRVSAPVPSDSSPMQRQRKSKEPVTLADRRRRSCGVSPSPRGGDPELAHKGELNLPQSRLMAGSRGPGPGPG